MNDAKSKFEQRIVRNESNLVVIKHGDFFDAVLGVGIAVVIAVYEPNVGGIIFGFLLGITALYTGFICTFISIEVNDLVVEEKIGTYKKLFRRKYSIDGIANLRINQRSAKNRGKYYLIGFDYAERKEGFKPVKKEIEISPEFATSKEAQFFLENYIRPLLQEKYLRMMYSDNSESSVPNE